MKYKQGDMLRNENGYEVTVLATAGSIVFLSGSDDFDVAEDFYTEEEVNKNYTKDEPLVECWCNMTSDGRVYSHDTKDEAIQMGNGCKRKGIYMKEAR